MLSFTVSLKDPFWELSIKSDCILHCIAMVVCTLKKRLCEYFNFLQKVSYNRTDTFFKILLSKNMLTKIYRNYIYDTPQRN